MPNSKQNPVKIRILKLLLFPAVIFLLQWLVGTYIRVPLDGEDTNFENIQRLNTYMTRPLDVLYFGDSTVWYCPETDTDKRSIDRMLRSMIPHLKLGCITNAAYQADVYAAYCQYIVSQEKKHKPRLIVIPINMRSFSPQWDRKPQYQFEKKKIILSGGLKHAFYRPLRIFKYKFNTITDEQYWDIPVFKGRQQIGTIKQMRGNKEQLILRYMYPLTVEHRKVKSLIKIAQLLFSHKIKAVFYITPLDYETGENYLPGEFKQQVQQNVRLIQSILKENHQQLLDLSMDLSENHFAWKAKAAPNEHLNQDGRKYVARQLARQINRFMPGKMEK
jgi:hypothetical protein